MVVVVVVVVVVCVCVGLFVDVYACVCDYFTHSMFPQNDVELLASLQYNHSLQTETDR